MVYDFVITLKRKDYATIDAVSQLMYVFALGAFSYFAYAFPASRPYFLAIDFFILLTWIFCTLKKQKKGFVLYRFGLFLAVIGWLLAPGSRIILAVLYGFAGLIEKQVKLPEEIGFTEEAVVINSFPKKKFLWSDITNIVLKDNVLTIDFKNNKLIQKEIDEGVSLSTENEFNEFCRKQLNKTTVEG